MKFFKYFVVLIGWLFLLTGCPSKQHEHNFIDGKCECGTVLNDHNHVFNDNGYCECGVTKSEVESGHIHRYDSYGYCECGHTQTHVHQFDFSGNCECGYVARIVHEVTFLNGSGEVFHRMYVEENTSAYIPFKPTKYGNIFVEWDQPIDCITKSMIVNPIFRESTSNDNIENVYITYTLSKNKSYYIVTQIVNQPFNFNYHIIIPSTYNGLPVKEIDTDIYLNSEIYSLTIPKSITKIKKFNLINELPSRALKYEGTIDDWLKIDFVNEQANPLIHCNSFYVLDEFGEMNEVTDLVIPETCKSINKYQLYGLKELKSLTIPTSIQFLDDKALGIGHINTLYYQGNVDEWCKITLNNSMFVNVDSVYFKNSENEFYPLKELVIPSSVKTIGAYQFANLRMLKNVQFSEGLETIDNCAFIGCEKLKNIDLPKSLINIGDNVFDECPNLELVKVKSNIEQIGSYAFGDEIYTYVIVDVTSPSSGWSKNLGNVNICYNKEFDRIITVNNSKYLVSDKTNKALLIKYGGTDSRHTVLSTIVFDNITYNVEIIGQYAYMNNQNLVVVTFEEGIKEIRKNAFENCTKLLAVYLPNSLEKKGENIFNGCDKLVNKDLLN